MNDIQFALVDARGRAAGAAVRSVTSLRPLPNLEPSRSTPRRRYAVVALTLLLLLAGLFVVSTRHDDPVDDHDPSLLRSVIDGLPDGWTASARLDPAIPADALLGRNSVFYGTPGDLTAPIVWLTWSDPSSPDGQANAGRGFVELVGLDGIREFQVNGDRAACGAGAANVRCVVDGADGLIHVAAQGVGLDRMISVMSTLQLRNGAASVDPSIIGPSATQLFAGPQLLAAPIGRVGSDGAATVYYHGPDDASAVLTVGWDDPQRFALLAAVWGTGDQPEQGAAWTRTTVAGVPGFTRAWPNPGDTMVAWEKDGRMYWMEVLNAPDRVAALAAGVRQATDTEWAAIPDGRDTGGSTAGTELVGAGSTDTEPPPSPPSSLAPGEEVDVTAEVDVAEVSNDVVQVSMKSPLPTDSVTVGFAVDSYRIQGSSGTVTGRLSSEPTMNLLPVGGLRGVFAIGTTAGELVVTAADGHRYHAHTTALFSDPTVQVAVLVMPADLVRAQFVAPDGTVLAKI